MAVGLPVEGIAILIALDAIPDILKGVLNVTAHMTAATVLAQGVQPVTPASRSSCRLHHPPTGRCGPKG